MRPPVIVASVLPADFSELGQQVQLLEQEGVDRIQWDAMDGRSVPNLTFGPDVIAASRRHVRLGFEVQLMVGGSRRDACARLFLGTSAVVPRNGHTANTNPAVLCRPADDRNP